METIDPLTFASEVRRAQALGARVNSFLARGEWGKAALAADELAQVTCGLEILARGFSAEFTRTPRSGKLISTLPKVAVA